VQSQTPGNGGQVLVVFNDGQQANDTMSMQVVGNTFIGNGTSNSAFVHLSNADGTKMSADLVNNVIFGTNKPTLVEDSGNGTITGKNNWLATGVAPGALTASVFSANPGFTNAAAMDFTLATGSAAIGAAATTVSEGAPVFEYFQNEARARMYRARSSAKDIGAFESTTTGAGTGPYGAPPSGDGGAASDGGGIDDGGGANGEASTFRPDSGNAGSDGGTNGDAPSNSDSGCGCSLVDASDGRAPVGIAVVLGLSLSLVARRRRERAARTPSAH
jgi:MYXO-CTERM domain-containing protein